MIPPKKSKLNQLRSIKRSIKLKLKSRIMSVTENRESSKRNWEAEVDDLKLKMNEIMRLLGENSKCQNPKRNLEGEVDELKSKLNDVMRMLENNLKLKGSMENVKASTQMMTSVGEIRVGSEVPFQILPSNVESTYQVGSSSIMPLVQKTSEGMVIGVLPNSSKILPNYHSPSRPSHSNPLNLILPPQAYPPTTPNPTSFNQAYPVNLHANIASRPLVRPGYRNKVDENTPFPNISMSKLELFKQLVDGGVITPRHIRPQQPPFPHWYNPDLRCEFHWGTVGHSIETCPAFKEIVICLLRRGEITIDGMRRRVIINTNFVPKQA